MPSDLYRSICQIKIEGERTRLPERFNHGPMGASGIYLLSSPSSRLLQIHVSDHYCRGGAARSKPYMKQCHVLEVQHWTTGEPLEFGQILVSDHYCRGGATQPAPLMNHYLVLEDIPIEQTVHVDRTKGFPPGTKSYTGPMRCNCWTKWYIGWNRILKTTRARRLLN